MRLVHFAEESQIYTVFWRQPPSHLITDGLSVVVVVVVVVVVLLGRWNKRKRRRRIRPRTSLLSPPAAADEI